MADELLDVLLNLRAKFFVRADEQTEKLAQELSDWAVLDVLTSTVRQDSAIICQYFNYRSDEAKTAKTVLKSEARC